MKLDGSYKSDCWFRVFSGGGFVLFMIVMSWNVRGLGKEEKMRNVRSSVLAQKPVVLFIRESKLCVFDNRIIRSIGGDLLTRGVGVEATGSPDILSLFEI